MALSQPQQETPFSRLDYWANEIAALDVRLQTVVDRIIGPRPSQAPSGGGGDTSSQPYALLDAMDGNVNRISHYVSRMNETLGSLESRLP